MIIYGLFLLFYVEATNDAKLGKKKSWRDKDIRDMTDADLEHLLDQWEVHYILAIKYKVIKKIKIINMNGF